MTNNIHAARKVEQSAPKTYTPYQGQYFAHALTLDGQAEDTISRSIASAKVDMNPHQVEAALFALRSPLSQGVILADEVGLGKTIEASLVIAQKWAERQRRILLIVPAMLRNQWAQELNEKFSMPTTIIETSSYNAAKKAGKLNCTCGGRFNFICQLTLKLPIILLDRWANAGRIRICRCAGGQQAHRDCEEHQAWHVIEHL